MLQTKFSDVCESRRNNLDFLRFLLATLVILSHSYPLLWGSDRLELCARITRQTTLGTLCVAGFFIISGFLISASWAFSKGLLDFLKKRALRIAPGYVVVLLFGALVVAPLARPGHSLALGDLRTWEYVYRPLLLGPLQPFPLPGVFVHNPMPFTVNGSLWTIPYEVKCYLMVAALGVLGLYRRPKVILALLLSMFVLYEIRFYLFVYGIPLGHRLAAFEHWSDLDRLLRYTSLGMAAAACYHLARRRYVSATFLILLALYNWRSHLPIHGHAHIDALLAHLNDNTDLNVSMYRMGTYYLVGVFYYVFRDKIPFSPVLFWGSVAAVATCCVWGQWLMLVLPLCGSYILLYVAFSPAVKLQDFGRRGDISYGVYLYAFPVQQLLVSYFGRHLNPILLFLIASPIVFGLAALSWHFVEKPFLRLKTKRKPALSAPVPQPAALPAAEAASLSQA